MINEFILTWVGLGRYIPPLQRLVFGPFFLNSGFASSKRSSDILEKMPHTHPQVSLYKPTVKDYSDNVIVVNSGLDSSCQMLLFLLTDYSSSLIFILRHFPPDYM